MFESSINRKIIERILSLNLSRVDTENLVINIAKINDEILQDLFLSFSLSDVRVQS